VLLLCSDGLTSMVPEERLEQILASAPDLKAAAQALIDEANAAGGRDNITVVLSRIEDVEAASDGGADQPTETGLRAVEAGGPDDAVAEPVAVGATAPETEKAGRGVLRRPSRKIAAALAAVVIVLFLIGGGGYIATRQLYFIGTNAQGIVTIYRGLPYDLPAGIHLYETYYVSGVPASLVPADRRSALLNNQLRSQKDASNLVRDVELGRLSK
jgi:protein phosphatase